MDNAPDRMAYMSRQLDPLGIPYERLPAVNGDRLEEPIDGYAEKKFHAYFGKATNKRAIGCYFSHIKALQSFLESDARYALILEDDAKLPVNLVAIMEAALPYGKNWDLLRLSSFRGGEFLFFGDLVDGFHIGYNLKILKNTAAYLINRHAAQQCITEMLPMFLPYDIALDREWHYGFKAACVSPFPVGLREELESQIPRGTKIGKYRLFAKCYNAYTRMRRRQARKSYFRTIGPCSATGRAPHA